MNQTETDELIKVYKQLGWIALGLLAWFGIRSASPSVAGIILAAFVLYALIRLAPTFNSMINTI